MSDRDELAQVIVAAYGEDAETECSCEQDMDVTDAILAAGYRKPRTITTVEELDMLPDNSVIEDGAGDVGVLLAGNVWYPETAPIPVRKVGKSYLPATVLYEPQP